MLRESQSLVSPLGYRCIGGYFFVLDAVLHQIFIEIFKTSSYPSRTVTLVSATHISEHIWWTQIESNYPPQFCSLIEYLGVRPNWLRELDLNQRPSGYEPDEQVRLSRARRRKLRHQHKSRRQLITSATMQKIILFPLKPTENLPYSVGLCLTHNKLLDVPKRL